MKRRAHASARISTATAAATPATRGKAAHGGSGVLAIPPRSPRVDVLEIRKSYGMSRATFRRFSGFSERSLANWEGGIHVPDQPTTRRLLELKRLREALGRVVQPDSLGTWMDEPNPGFEGLKPLELVERGQIDRLWRMVFELESGMAA